MNYRNFYGYHGHFQYLDYFVKTDVAKREGGNNVVDKNKKDGGNY